jgi:ABC-type Fe3+/spermidine/putrescine transport system ATPase subunit
MATRRPYERNVGLVFQDYALFPHMTVAENIAYGMRHRGMPKTEIPQRVRARLAQVKLTGYDDRWPSQLSGGEQQRVALARALATEPEVLLLDEPLSNLDAKLRQELRLELKSLLKAVQTTTIIVTHDQEEAISLSDHIVIMNRGRVEQRGTPAEIYGHPRTRFVAEFMGRTNWFSGRVAETGSAVWRVTCDDIGTLLVEASDLPLKPGDPVNIAVRPEQMALSPARDGLEAANCIVGRIEMVEYLGADIHHWIRADGGSRVLLVEKNIGQVIGQPGMAVKVHFAARGCIVLAST